MTLQSRRRGSALVMALLVVLVLTTVGIGLAYLTTVEDRISGNARIQKAGFYAAESGLRTGEQFLSEFVAGNLDPNTLLPTAADVAASPAPAKTYDPPGGGYRARLLEDASTSFYQQVAAANLDDPNARLVFSLYIRNAAEDSSGNAFTNVDKKVNLIAVGEYVTVDSAGNIVSRGIQKVLEEQVNLKPEGNSAATQEGGVAGGTGSGTKG